MKKKLIVSAVRKIKTMTPEGVEKDCVQVSYTNGTTKEFSVNEWLYSYGEGRRLWEEHEKEFKNPENFDG
jgi:hypothetical protein|tara:strand:- start:611 stop:820 length:210 start_codon:yes stop_codon:yes gene_type:complete